MVPSASLLSSLSAGLFFFLFLIRDLGVGWLLVVKGDKIRLLLKFYHFLCFSEKKYKGNKDKSRDGNGEGR